MKLINGEHEHLFADTTKTLALSLSEGESVTVTSGNQKLKLTIKDNSIIVTSIKKDSKNENV